MKRLSLLPVLAVLACGPATPEPPTPSPDGPPGVILFVGDGAGIAYWSAAKLASRAPLGIEEFPVIGLVDTESADHRVTDSAAGATAYASGIRTFNGAIGVAPDTTSMRTVLEVAESRGRATGLVATSTVTHATPAAFAAHVPSRDLHFAIAQHMAGQGIDVLLGGGRRFFDPAEREDGLDLIGRLEQSGAAYVEDAEAFMALDPDTIDALVGLFAETNPGSALERKPTLAQLTDAALAVLARDPDGFFLMVEGSQIDWRGHDNAPLDEVAAEVLDFDLAIRRALRFQERHPNTLIVVLADHSTGGLALHPDEDGVMRAHYTTEGHTAELIPMFASGPGSAVFGGVMDNDEVGRLLLRTVGGEEGPLKGSRVITDTGSQ